MSKIALITDTHWGVRGDNILFLNNNKKFLDNIFFPYLKEHNISNVIHLGDIVDRRKYINIYTSNRLRVDFLEPLYEMNTQVHFIVGNHDTYFKNTNKVNILRELIDGKYSENFKIYDNLPTEVDFNGVPVLLIPWICDENRLLSLKIISETKCQIAAGHLEIAGFEMYKGSIVSHGDDKSIYDKFDICISGHFHHRSSDGSIFYLGSHGEFTWSDYDDPRGFHILDTETRKLEFIENPYKIFKKIWYDDSKDFDPNQDLSEYKNTMIKIIVVNKNNPYIFDRFLENLEAEEPLDIKIVEDHLNLDLEDDQDIVNEAESTLDIFKKYIENNEMNVNKEKLSQMIVNLHNEALTVE